MSRRMALRSTRSRRRPGVATRNVGAALQRIGLRIESTGRRRRQSPSGANDARSRGKLVAIWFTSSRGGGQDQRMGGAEDRERAP